jgi:hypothetical protein
MILRFEIVLMFSRGLWRTFIPNVSVLSLVHFTYLYFSYNMPLALFGNGISFELIYLLISIQYCGRSLILLRSSRANVTRLIDTIQIDIESSDILLIQKLFIDIAYCFFNRLNYCIIHRL